MHIFFLMLASLKQADNLHSFFSFQIFFFFEQTGDMHSSFSLGPELKHFQLKGPNITKKDTKVSGFVRELGNRFEIFEHLTSEKQNRMILFVFLTTNQKIGGGILSSGCKAKSAWTGY